MNNKINAVLIGFVTAWLGVVTPAIGAYAIEKSQPTEEYQATCFLKSEGPVQGTMKACYYNCNGTPYTRMVSSYSYCEYTISVDM